MADFIDRQAVIDYLTLNSNWHDEDGYRIENWDERKAVITDLINGVPSAEPERKTGEWVTGEFTVESGECYCSVCETYYYAYDLMQIGESIYGIEKATLPNFCPHCGAKMTEG